MKWIMILLMVMSQGDLSQGKDMPNVSGFPIVPRTPDPHEKLYEFPKPSKWNADFIQVQEICKALKTNKDASLFCEKLLPIIKKLPSKRKVTLGVYSSYPDDLFELALRTIAELPKSDLQSKEILYCQGILLQKKGDYEAAAQAIDAALKLSPQNPDFLMECGRIWQVKENYDTAKTFFEKTLSIDPNHPGANFGMGFISGKEKNDLAINHLEKTIQGEPNHTYAHIFLALAMVPKDNIQKAIEESQIAMKLDPKNAYACSTYAYALTAKQQAREAIAIMSKAIELSPLHARHYYNRAKLYRYFDESEKAQEDIRQACMLAPDDIRNIKLYAKICSRGAKSLEFISVLTHGISLDKSDPELYYFRADAYATLEMYALAERDLNKVIELDPKYWLAYSGRGWTLHMQGKYYAAEKDARRFLEYSPQNKSGLLCLAETLFMTARYQKAVDVLTKLINLGPERHFYRMRSEAYQKLNQMEAAKNDLEMAH